MEMVIKKWGNSLAARIPAAIAKTLKIDVDQRVNMEIKGGKLIITPVTNIQYNLDDLLKNCPPKAMRLDDENREWLNAAPVGKEEW
ncbi:MAG: AbrB/MazE/SpoVT family DNA-binding domain-containing protein [Desulfobacterium sp.]